MFEVEEILNDSILFYRVHKTYVRDGQLIPGVFKERGEGVEKGMSTDWNKYSTAEQALERSANIQDNGIVEGIIEKIRNIPLPVVHFPYDYNRAHSNILQLGEGVQLTNNRRMLLLVFSQWSIKIA